jgi:hypothetical protein
MDTTFKSLLPQLGQTWTVFPSWTSMATRGPGRLAAGLIWAQTKFRQANSTFSCLY